MELCHYIPSCPPFFSFTHISPAVGINRILCISSSFVKAGHDCRNLDRPCVFSSHLYPFIQFSISPFHLGVYFMSVNHFCNLPYFLYLNGKNYQLSSDERVLLMTGLIKLLCAVIENTTQRLATDHCCASVSTCVKVSSLPHRLFVCVRKELCYFSQLPPYQFVRPVHFI